MEKRSVNVQVGDKEYTLEYSRRTITKAEEAFGISMLKRTEPETVKELVEFLKALLYGALIKHHPNITVDKMDDVYEQFTGEEGYEQEALIEGLIELLSNVLNPTGGGRKKKLLKAKK